MIHKRLTLNQSRRLHTGKRHWILRIVALLCASSVTIPAKAQSTSEMLRLLGVQDEHLTAFIDGQPADEDETEPLLRMLNAAGRFDTLRLHRGIRNDVTLEDLSAQPSTFRGEIVQLQGRLQKVQVEETPAELATRFELPKYYRCEVLLEPSQLLATVYAITVPHQWAEGAGDLDQPISFVGFFIKTASESEDDPQPVFVTRRLAWHPATTLGKLGMDVGLFDTVSDHSPIKASEREAFYQLLAAAGRAEIGQLDRLTQDDYSVEPLFNAPELQRGRLVGLSGVARRITKVVVDDPDIVERFGIDHYYEVGVFTDDSQGNPVIFCVRELPEGMPTGDRISEAVRIPAFFLKTWTFETAQLNQKAAEQAAEGQPRQRLKQVAPLLIGKSLHWQTAPVAAPPGISGWVAGSLFLLALAGVWFGAWRRHKADRTYAQGTLARAREPEESTLDTSGFEAMEEEPNFSDE